MKDVTVSIRTTEIKSMKYENTFSGKPGEQMRLQVKNGFNIMLNPAAPTSAAVFTKFSAEDEEGKVKFELETATPVSVSTFVDNLDELIKEEYLNVILLAVNERIRMAATLVGLNINAPMVNFKRNV